MARVYSFQRFLKCRTRRNSGRNWENRNFPGELHPMDDLEVGMGLDWEEYFRPGYSALRPVKCIVPLDNGGFRTGCFNPKVVRLARSLAATEACQFRKMKAAPAHAMRCLSSSRIMDLPRKSQEVIGVAWEALAKRVRSLCEFTRHFTAPVLRAAKETYRIFCERTAPEPVPQLDLLSTDFAYRQCAAIRTTSYDRRDGVETIRYAPRFKPPREKRDFHVGTYRTRQDAQVALKIAAFYFGKDEEGTVDLGDGFSFDIPSMTAGESGLSSETKRVLIKDKTKGVLKTYKTEKAAWVENLINGLLVGPPIVEGRSIQQPDRQDELPDARLNIIGESQPDHRQTGPELNVSEEQPECSRIHEEQQQQHRETLQQLEERNLEIVELEKQLEERDFENFELQRENSQLRQRLSGWNLSEI